MEIVVDNAIFISVDLGAAILRWQVAKATLNLYPLPGGGIHRAAWHLDTNEGIKLGVILLDTAGGNNQYSPDGINLAELLKKHPHFNFESYRLAENAIAENRCGSFDCIV